MTKLELIRATAEKAGVTIKDTKVLVNALFEVIEETLTSGEDVAVVGFGTYSTITKPAHEGRNPQTGEVVDVPEKRYARFKYSTRINNALNA